MGEASDITRISRGKRVVEVARDERGFTGLTVELSGSSATAILDDRERKRLIEALGGKVDE